MTSLLPACRTSWCLLTSSGWSWTAPCPTRRMTERNRVSAVVPPSCISHCGWFLFECWCLTTCTCIITILLQYQGDVLNSVCVCLIFSAACGTAFDFHKQIDYLFLVGTEDGKIHKVRSVVATIEGGDEESPQSRRSNCLCLSGLPMFISAVF